jgi:hypothetical protein
MIRRKSTEQSAEIASIESLHESFNEADVQSGDLQGLSREEDADSESIAELASEGQSFEAEAIGGVEYAGDSPVRELRTRQVREDDVPLEYLNQER